MNIRSALLTHYSRKGIQAIVTYVGTDARRFKDLMTVFIEGPYRLTQRATQPLEGCVKNQERLLYPYLAMLLKMLSQKDAHPSICRNILRTLQFIAVPARHQARLFDQCLAFTGDGDSPIAIRVFAMTVAANIAMERAELKTELAELIADRLPYESAGFVSRGKKMLTRLSKVSG